MQSQNQSVFQNEYEKFIFAADKYFGGFCLYSAGLATYAWWLGEATLMSPVLICSIIAYNVGLSQVLSRTRFISNLKGEIIFRQLPNAILCPIAFFSLAPSLSPWWPIFLTFPMVATVSTGFSYSNRNISRVFVLLWLADLLAAAWWFKVQINFYQIAYLAGAIVMVGFVSADWMFAAKKSLDKEIEKSIELEKANLRLVDLQAQLQKSLTKESSAKMELEFANQMIRKVQIKARIGFWIWNLADQKMTWSEELREIFGLETFANQPTLEELFERVHPDDRETLKLHLKLAELGGNEFEFEFRMTNFKMKQIHVLHSVEIESNDGEKHTQILGVFQDVTDRAKANRIIEEQKAELISANKLSELGQMAAGVAHEINTPLGAIIMNIDIMKYNAMKAPFEINEFIKRADKITSITNRIAKIIDGLKQFSTQSNRNEFTVLKLGQVIDDTLRLCREKLRSHNIDLTYVAVSDETEVFANAAQISQTLLNLINNSFDAISNEAKKWIRIEVNSNGEKLYLSVTDSGPGISAKVEASIFNPFFTTKDVGKGVGLGLSISKNMMQAHGGDLFYDKTCPNTKFTMMFPVRKSQGEAA